MKNNTNNETKSFIALNMDEMTQFLTNKIMERCHDEKAGQEAPEEWMNKTGEMIDSYLNMALCHGVIDEGSCSYLYGTSLLAATIFGMPPLMYHWLISRRWDGRGTDFAEHWCEDFIEIIRNPVPEDK